jgi:hypothetical protein
MVSGTNGIMDYSSTVENKDWGGEALLASMIRMQLATVMIHLSEASVHKRIAEEVARKVRVEGIAKEVIDRCIVAVLKEETIEYLVDRSIDEEKILAAVRELAQEQPEHLEALQALRFTGEGER